MTSTGTDVEEINNLLFDYNIAIDSGDIDGFLATFMPDGAFDGIHGRFEGTAELRRFVTAYWTEPEFARLRGTQHWLTNIRIRVSGDSATSYCYGTVLSQGTADNKVMGTWHYRDKITRLDGEWKFSERYVRPFEPGSVTGEPKP
jgi:ketosteroid isomerase-like protein